MALAAFPCLPSLSGKGLPAAGHMLGVPVPAAPACAALWARLSFTVLAKPSNTTPGTRFPFPLILSPSRKVYFLKPTA